MHVVWSCRDREPGRYRRTERSGISVVSARLTGASAVSTIRVVGIRLLGPLEIDGFDRPLSPRDRVVLSALAIRRREVVGADQLADALWGDEPPASWPKVVQSCIVRLRRTLGSSSIETAADGYRLLVEPGAVDIDEFEAEVARARSFLAQSDAERAASALARALTLWRGEPCVDLDRWLPGRTEATRLRDLRRTVEEELLECRLAAGEHRDVAAEAAARVAEEPLRERRWAILALAQYRSGRQGDALRSLHEARATLATQLGIDPSAELVELEGAILRQDSDLDSSVEPSQISTRCPYKGLAPYGVDDGGEFFGRQKEIDACLERLRSTPLLVIAGSSGCGKSSLARAGLVPQLEHRGHSCVVFVPGARPTSALTAALASSARTPVLVVDQSEELVTLADRDDASEFCTRLAEHTRQAPVVLTVRADYLAVLAAEPRLKELAERGLHFLSPLAGDALVEAIEGPAAMAGLRLEPGLVDLLLRDISGEPGALPLLSHALAETWRMRDGRVLTVDGYRSTGGIQGAVARSADRVYESLAVDQRELLRTLLLRLIARTPGGDAVRIRAGRRQLVTSIERERLIELLVNARLLTVEEDTVQVAHEALVSAWPRLQGWLDDDVVGQRTLRHLSAAAEGWDALDRAPSELYRGTRLDTAVEWRDADRPDLTELEHEFLDASMDAADTERRTLEAEARRQARQNRRLRELLGAAAVFLALSLAAGTVALSQRNRAANSANIARVAERAAEAQRLSALALSVDEYDTSLLLAIEGRHLADSADTRTNLLTAMNRRPQAIEVIRHPALSTFGRLVFTKDGRNLIVGDLGGLVFFDASTRQVVAHPIDTQAPLPAMAPTPDGTGVGVVIDDAIHFFDGATGRETRLPVDFEAEFSSLSHNPVVAGLTLARSLAFSADGRFAAVAGDAEYASGTPGFELVFDLTAPSSAPRRLTSGFERPSVAFNSTNQLVVADAGPHPHVAIVDSETGGLVANFDGLGAPVAVSSTDSILAARAGDGIAVVDWLSGKHRVDLKTGSPPVALAFSADGLRLAIAAEDRTIDVWDARSGARIEHLAGQAAPAHSVAFDASGGTLYTISSDGSVVAWDLDGRRRQIRQVAAPDRTSTALALVAPRPDGDDIAYVYQDASDIDSLAIREHPDAPIGDRYTTGHGLVTWADWTPDGARLLTLGTDGNVRAWDPATGALVASQRLPSESGSIGWRAGGDTFFVGLHDHGVAELNAETLEIVGNVLPFDRYVSNVDVSPDGKMLAVAMVDPRAVALVDLASREVVGTIDGVDADWRLSFAPDGSVLVAGGSNGVVTLIDPRRRAISGTFVSVDGPIVSAAFSPDGSQLVTGSTNGALDMWDLVRRDHIARVTPDLSGHRIFAWFDETGETIVAADERGGIWQLPSDPDEWERRACQIAGRNFTQAEWRELNPNRPYERTCPAFPAGT